MPFLYYNLQQTCPSQLASIMFFVFQMRPGNPCNPQAVAVALPLAKVGEGIPTIRTSGHY